MGFLDEGADRHPIVPVGREVLDVAIGNLGVDPRQHGLLGGESAPCAADLEASDERPDEAHDELEVAIEDVLRAWEGEKSLWV